MRSLLFAARLPVGYWTFHRKIHRNQWSQPETKPTQTETKPNRILRGFIVPIQGSNPRESPITVIIFKMPRRVTFSPTPATKPCESPFCLRIWSFRASRWALLWPRIGPAGWARIGTTNGTQKRHLTPFPPRDSSPFGAQT
jgi:hypothetical protein